MKKLIYTCMLALSFWACQNTGNPGHESTSSDSTAIDANAGAVSQTSCYIRAEGQDTTWVSLTVNPDGSVSGTYDWVPYEKDSARGTLSGKKEGEILTLIYDYMIEGSQQQQEMIMKMAGDQLAEGQTELVEGEGGLLKIKDLSNVQYFPFVKVECE